MAAAVRLLLEFHSTHVGAHLCGAVTTTSALALGTLKRASVKMHHRDMAGEPIEEGELTETGFTLVIALLQVHSANEVNEQKYERRVRNELRP